MPRDGERFDEGCSFEGYGLGDGVEVAGWCDDLF